MKITELLTIKESHLEGAKITKVLTKVQRWTFPLLITTSLETFYRVVWPYQESPYGHQWKYWETGDPVPEDVSDQIDSRVESFLIKGLNYETKTEGKAEESTS